MHSIQALGRNFSAMPLPETSLFCKWYLKRIKGIFRTKKRDHLWVLLKVSTYSRSSENWYFFPTFCQRSHSDGLGTFLLFPLLLFLTNFSLKNPAEGCFVVSKWLTWRDFLWVKGKLSLTADRCPLELCLPILRWEQKTGKVPVLKLSLQCVPTKSSTLRTVKVNVTPCTTKLQ